MEDVVGALARFVGNALVYLLWELLLHGSARLIYGRGDRPRHRVQRFVMRLVALGSGAVAIHGLVHSVPESPRPVLGFFLAMFALLVMIVGEHAYGRKGLCWLAALALFSLFGALGFAVMG